MKALILWVLLGLSSATAWAHKPSDSYLVLTVDKAMPKVQLDIALRDLDFAIGLDRNGDGQITWYELRQAQSLIQSYVFSRLDITANGQACKPSVQQLMFNEHVDGGYAVLMLVLDCGKAHAPYSINYRLFFDVDRLHRSVVTYKNADANSTMVLSADKREVTFAAGVSAWKQWLSFVHEGIGHIGMGFDHILFLLSLLLPAVMILQDRRWQPAASFRDVFLDTAGIVTAFTVAHSITLTLAVYHIISLPSRWVESLIALSVIVAAINNLYPVVHRRRWLLTFAFGLIHGFGFASALAELGLGQRSLLLSISGFNIGVEVGQLLIVLAFLPLAFFLRKRPVYLYLALRTGSVAIIGIAGIWLFERVFNLQVLPALGT